MSWQGWLCNLQQSETDKLGSGLLLMINNPNKDSKKIIITKY